jgi:hypothetical protein
VCNLYSQTRGQQAIREFTRAMTDRRISHMIVMGRRPAFVGSVGSMSFAQQGSRAAVRRRQRAPSSATVDGDRHRGARQSPC